MLESHGHGLLRALNISFFEEDMSECIPAIPIGGVEFDLP